MSNLKEHLQNVVNRSSAFYQKTEPGHYLVCTDVPADVPPPIPLWEFDLDHQLTDWLDFKLTQERAFWRTKDGLDDDTLPALCPFFGIAEHSAWLGQEVLLQEDTCLPIANIKEHADLAKLRFSEADKWFGYMKSSYEYLHSRQDGSFFLSVRGTMSPMDIANALRGDELFIDFLTQPEFVHELLAFIVKAFQWYYPRLHSWADSIAGGHIYRLSNIWMPPGTIGHLANDAAMLCSADIYAKFGYPYELQIVKDYEHILFHVHNEKMHYVPQLVQLPGMSLLEVTNDPTAPSSAENLERVFAATGSAKLMLTMTSEQVRAHLDEMGGRNIFLRVECLDYADAQDVITFVRDRSKPL